MYFDAIVVGGGFFGLRIALHLREELAAKSVLILEREPELMSRASFVNQARIHNGYHYPRSVLTAYRSRVNFPKFKNEFQAAVVDDFNHYYAIASRQSKTNSRQFEEFCSRVGASLEPAPAEARSWFDPGMVSSVHRVIEPAFDSRIVRNLLLQRIEDAGEITVTTGRDVIRVAKGDRGLEVVTEHGTYRSPRVISTTYSGINVLNVASGVAPLAFQHEVTEMPLVELPSKLQRAAFTVMDGPFFSLMPFPSSGHHTLSHVRYTPHYRWFDRPDSPQFRDPVITVDSMDKVSNYAAMRADAMRFMPILAGMRQADSLWEAKTVLTASESDDSRPILYQKSAELPGFTTIMGGKLDNVYDVLGELSTHD